MKRRRVKKKIKKVFTAIVLFALIISIFLIYKICFNSSSKEHKNFSENVITTDEIKIYTLDNDEYKESGLIGKNIELSLKNKKCMEL